MIIDLNTAEKVPFDLDGRIMFNSEKVQLIHLSLMPGDVVAPHSNPFDVVFYVLEGEGIISVGDETAILNEDQTIDVAKDIQRGWRNVSDQILRLLVVKVF
ncbi:MAG: cupin domain-containing protein [Bacteroidales bacterium]|nr:cupin domain-containing protein [Bacteroidales bacterium]MCF8456890.1 cupin domain-containing protein [Bacteroidales bacterium]